MTLRVIEKAPEAGAASGTSRAATSPNAGSMHEPKATGVEAGRIEITGRRARAERSERSSDAPKGAHPRGPFVVFCWLVLMCVTDRLLADAYARERRPLPLDWRGLSRPGSQRKDRRGPF